MKRRSIVGIMGGLATNAALPLLAQSQRRARLGILATFPPSNAAVVPLWTAFYAELAARGWVDGRNMAVEARYSEGNPEKDETFAKEILASAPEVILGSNSRAVEFLRKATSSIPIVMVNVSHAVEVGFVASLARPGGNVTGVVNQAGDMQGKFIELLRAVKPGMTRMGAIWSPNNLGSALAFKDTQAAAAGLGVRLTSLAVDQSADIEPALSAAQREGVQALQVHPTGSIASGWRQIQAWASQRQVITLGQAQWVRGGFLMSYWADIPEIYRTSATFVDRIFRGAKPADLPVEQPTKFELVINLKTARSIGVSVPQSLILLATELIE